MFRAIAANQSVVRFQDHSEQFTRLVPACVVGLLSKRHSANLQDARGISANELTVNSLLVL